MKKETNNSRLKFIVCISEIESNFVFDAKQHNVSFRLCAGIHSLNCVCCEIIVNLKHSISQCLLLINACKLNHIAYAVPVFRLDFSNIYKWSRSKLWNTSNFKRKFLPKKKKKKNQWQSKQPHNIIPTDTILVYFSIIFAIGVNKLFTALPCNWWKISMQHEATSS